MNEIEQKFARVWVRLTSDWSSITMFRKMGVQGEIAATEAIRRENQLIVNEFMQGRFEHLLKDKALFIQKGLHESMPVSMTESAVQNYRQMLFASTLVFAHSVLDAAVFDCVTICGDVAPLKWRDILGKRKLEFSTIVNESPESILKQLIAKEVKDIERKSLLEKVDRIHQICPPTKSSYLTNGFQFDRERLERLDDLRHKVVHEPGAQFNFDALYEDLEFMRSTGLHLFSMLGECFDLYVTADSNIKSRSV